MMVLIKKTKTAESAIMKNPPLRVYKNEEGVAIIMALIMLLVMSVLATTVSFNSNNDFRAMSNYKQGQEAFLAAENCVRQEKKVQIIE
jgi:Tfp pilus assembly protein PilX